MIPYPSRQCHAVTAIARNPGKIASHANVTAIQGDVLDQAGHDAAVSSVHFLDSDPVRLITAARDSKVGRYLVVGGAGSLGWRPASGW